MKVLITGATGQVGAALIRQAPRYAIDCIACDRHRLDITDPSQVRAAVRKAAPDAVINAAAYTAVDRAEQQRGQAWRLNVDAVGHLAAECAACDIPLVHLSTDYVFDGEKRGAYREGDAPAPRSVYGASKLAGEEVVTRGCRKYFVLRTSWVFSSRGSNFVKTMLRMGRDRDEIAVVGDQHGRPTSAHAIARAIYIMLTSGRGEWGIYHFAQPEETTWYCFADAIFDEASRQGMALRIKRLREITSADYPTAAIRPANSVLDCTKWVARFGQSIPPWQESLREVVDELRDQFATS